MIDIHSFKTSAHSLADMLRQGKDEVASSQSALLLQKLTLIREQLPVELQASLLQLAKQMVACQKRRDWVGMCDYLEFELLVLLDEIEGMQGSSSNALVPRPPTGH